MTLPRCPDDARYVKSFEVADLAAQNFFKKYGFVVFQDVLSPAECEATVAEIWTSLEERTEGLQRHQMETWSLLSSERYGLPEEQAVFTPQMVANRQNQRVYAALDAVLPHLDPIEDFDSPHPSPNSVVVTQDRWCIYRPAGHTESWRTAENLHLDVNPWTYAGLKPTEIETLRYGTTISGDHRFPLQDFRAELTAVQGRGAATGEHVQGVLNLLDNLEEDGGTRVVPGFHRCFMQWLEALGDMENNLAQSGQRDNWVLRRAAGGLPLLPLAPHVFGEVKESKEPLATERPLTYKPGDSRQRLAVEQVLLSSPSNPKGVLKAFEDFHVQCKPLLHVGPVKGIHLDTAVRQTSPRVALELGSYLGYSAVRIAQLLQDGAVLYTIEEDRDNAIMADAIIQHAGLSNVVVLQGKLESVQSQLPRPMDLVFLDHSKALYLSEIQRLEELGFIQPGTTVVADNIGGCQRVDCGRMNCGCAYARYVRDTGRYSSDFFWGSRDGIEVSIAKELGMEAPSHMGATSASMWTCQTLELPYLVRHFEEQLTQRLDSCIGPYVVDVAVCASATCFSAANVIMKPRLLVLLKEYQRHRKLSDMELTTFVDFMAAGALACGFYRFCEFNVRQRDSSAQAKDTYQLMRERAELLLKGSTREDVIAVLQEASAGPYQIGFHKKFASGIVMRRYVHLAVVLVALLLNLQGCDEEDEPQEEKVTAPVVGGNLTENKTVDVWVGEHSNRPAYTGPPAKLGLWDEKGKGIKPDPLPGKGGKLLEAERSYERALFSSNDAERQEHRLEKEKHLEDYLRDHPPPPSSTKTKGPITTLSTNTSKPGSEGDKGSGEGTSNTDAKENTEPSTEPAKQSTPIEEPEADKTLKSANESVAGNNSRNATGPAAATRVGSSESAPTPKVKEALAIESAKKLVPSEKHAVIKVPWASHEAGGTKMDEADSEKLDEAGAAGGTKMDEADLEKLDEAGAAGGTKKDAADSEKLDEAGGSKMDADEEEEVPPKIEGGTSGDPNEPTKTDQGEVQVDEEMASPQDGANSEEKDSTDDSSKETSSQQGQEEDDSEESSESEDEVASRTHDLSAMELGEAKRAARLHRLHSEHEALHELEAPFHSAFLLLVLSATFAHADETSTWSSFIHCKCGVACAKQLESWYMFDIGQSCACESCPESGHLRGSHEDLQAASEEKKVQTELVEKPDAAEKSRSTESSEPKVKVSQSLQSSAENEKKWDGASVRGTNLLYCKCGKGCTDLRQTGRNTFYCYNYACRQCSCTTTFC
eukprot:symbB.v1.2.019632.t3/scaffold1616.1/size109294/8